MSSLCNSLFFRLHVCVSPRPVFLVLAWCVVHTSFFLMGKIAIASSAKSDCVRYVLSTLKKIILCQIKNGFIIHYPRTLISLRRPSTPVHSGDKRAGNFCFWGRETYRQIIHLNLLSVLWQNVKAYKFRCLRAQWWSARGAGGLRDSLSCQAST